MNQVQTQDNNQNSLSEVDYNNDQNIISQTIPTDNKLQIIFGLIITISNFFMILYFFRRSINNF